MGGGAGRRTRGRADPGRGPGLQRQPDRLEDPSAGYLARGKPLDGPGYLGFDAAGVVDEVGEGVTDVAVGDDVFGLGSNTNAEFAVLDAWAEKPASVDWAVAAAAGSPPRPAIRAFDLLGVKAGSTVFDRRRRGRRRRGRGADRDRPRRHGDRLGGRGQPGLPARDRRDPGAVRRRRGRPGAGDRPGGVDAVFDVAGKTPVADLISLVPEPSQVLTIANFAAGEPGVQLTTGRSPHAKQALAETAELLEQNKLVIKFQTFPLDRAAEAHAISQHGHLRGKLVLVP